MDRSKTIFIYVKFSYFAVVAKTDFLIFEKKEIFVSFSCLLSKKSATDKLKTRLQLSVLETAFYIHQFIYDNPLIPVSTFLKADIAIV